MKVEPPKGREREREEGEREGERREQAVTAFQTFAQAMQSVEYK
jgi:predicted transposase YdaD